MASALEKMSVEQLKAVKEQSDLERIVMGFIHLEIGKGFLSENDKSEFGLFGFVWMNLFPEFPNILHNLNSVLGSLTSTVWLDAM
ncbi:uncharacterized protein G2W53_032512 [Senna tora]|uniref:Uncharacterized protein n=1 Tax=Senna tora TaxID=362788 RepID=A0A834WAA3_9FABA|nr:uncharacterized protein G2W53_032512 [Senna tora]